MRSGSEFNGQQREYRDPARDCARRARLAALFAAIALGLPLPAPAAAPAAVTRVPAAASPARRPSTQVEVGVATEAGLASEYRVMLVGASLRVATGAGSWKLVTGAAVLAAGDVAVAPLTISYTHAPIDVALRLDGRAARFEGSIEAGPAVGLLWLRAAGLAQPDSALMVEWGGRASLLLRYRISALVTPFVGVAAQVVAFPADLQTLPRGTIGRARRLWLGASVGANVAF